MNDVLKRHLLFLLLCIPSRIYLVYIVKKKQYKNLTMIFLLIMFIAWMYIYLNDYRKTGMEVFGKEIWWNNLRPIHAILYLSSAYLLYNDQPAYYPLLLDVSIGLTGFIDYHHLKN